MVGGFLQHRRKAFQSTWENTSSVESDGSNDYFNDIFTINSTTGAISFWIYRDNTTNIERLMTVAATPWASNDQFYINARSASSGNALDVEARMRIGGTDHWHYKWNTSINATTWYHILITHNATVPKLYLDGTEITTITKDASGTESSWFAALHSNNIDEWQWCNRDTGAATTTGLQGEICEVSLWNTAVAAKEVRDSTTGLPVNPEDYANFGTECELYLQTGDNAGDNASTIIDVTSNGRDHAHQNQDADPYSTNVPT